VIADTHELWTTGLEWAAWLIAGAWVFRAADLVKNIPRIAALTGIEWDALPGRPPSLTVVVPACNEEAHIAATLDALLLSDYPVLKVLAIDDRSTDTTGTIMDAYAAEYASRKPGVLDVIHVRDLPQGWLGKTHALHLATERTDSDFLLFTDADVLFSPSILRRAMSFVEAESADHVVVLPTMQIRTRGEGIVLGFFQVLGMWAARPWMVEKTKARDAIGIGAFNLVRRSAFLEIGGWQPQRMVILEDITLGRRMKAAGKRQRIAFAPGLVLVHWASGVLGLVRVMTKNLFSAMNFRPLLLLGAMSWMIVFFLSPLAGLFWLPTLVPALAALLSIGAVYRTLGQISQIDARYGWLYPLGTAAFLWAMVRSMIVAFMQGGVEWRGTLYPLRELRRHNSQFQWKRETAKKTAAKPNRPRR
jgi:cellulose synthase/poly-beta-1,6-N-acetylglucosamine synthase-like glycosyltransferase